jgi:hypothetical protein
LYYYLYYYCLQLSYCRWKPKSAVMATTTTTLHNLWLRPSTEWQTDGDDGRMAPSVVYY